jgi:hypothetical protein
VFLEWLTWLQHHYSRVCMLYFLVDTALSTKCIVVKSTECVMCVSYRSSIHVYYKTVLLILLSPTGAEDFYSSPCVQTGSEAHPASYPMGTGGPFPEGKARPECDADHSPPSSGRGVGAIPPLPHAPPWRVAGYFFY